MVKKSELYFNDKIFPKRLLDVDATVESQGGFYFVVPADWDFHVISHTWTDGISTLATDCKAILTANGWTREADPQGLIYNQTFTKSQFSDKSYYKELVNYLTTLQSDGVRSVWFDALCINQLDDEEKAQEMLQMGAYYGLSKACYVATHGIGSPNGFQVLDSNQKLPRWFSRVWTLQESILPGRTYFLVEKFGADILKFIEDEPSSHQDDKAWTNWDTNDVIHDNRYVSGGGDYSRRKAGGSSSSDLYFLGSKAYFDMMGTLLAVRVHGLSDLPPKLFEDFYEAFGELASGAQTIDLETLVKQIRVRNASVEEDRVMGILGLIGFRGDHALKANQTLDIQLVGLAKMLLKDKDLSHLLINLCAAEYEGYEVAGISWAPDLRADPDASREEFRRYFVDFAIVKDYGAVVTNVEEDGSLVMKAQIVKGKLIKAADDENGISYKLKVGIISINLRHDTDLVDNLPIHTQYGEHESGWIGGMMVAAPGIHKLKGYNSAHKAFTVADISLVFLGHNGNPHERGTTCVLLACIPIGDQKLHKIGTIHPHPSLTARARKLFVSEATQVVIGGVGGDLTPFLDKECQSVLKSLAS